MSTISKWKHKHFDIEVKDQNETETFDLFSIFFLSKADLFFLIQKWSQQTISILSKNLKMETSVWSEG